MCGRLEHIIYPQLFGHSYSHRRFVTVWSLKKPRKGDIKFRLITDRASTGMAHPVGSHA